MIRIISARRHLRLHVVVFVERGHVRLISTRRATPFERHAYEEANR
jgi:uncharacterized DUF497 family protein